MEHARPPAELCLEGGPACRAESWRKWHKQFCVFLKASGVYKEPKDVQASLLINLIGPEGYDVYTTFKFTKDENKDCLDTLVKKYNEHFETKQNTTMARFKFFTRNQESGESIDDYVTVLKLLTQYCEFEHLEEGLVRDRIVCGVRDGKLRDRLLRADDLTLAKAVKICQASEMSTEEQREIEGCKTGNEGAGASNVAVDAMNVRGWRGGSRAKIPQMTEVADASTWSPTELLAAGRRHLAVKDFTSAVETLANACELLAKEHGDTADQCAEAYLWYGKALLGLSREESGVLGDGMPGTANADAEEDDNEDDEDNDEEQNGEAEAAPESGEASSSVDNNDAEATTKEPASSTVNDEPGISTADDAEPGTTNGEADESMMAVDEGGEEDVDNLQLAWEMLDLARSILVRRVSGAADGGARALLAEVHLALGEVALESETYDKAVIDMQSCLELQKDLYGSDDRRIAETHYQIGLANSLASSFEDAITHFKNAANILQSRIKTLENPASNTDATVKKHSADSHHTVESEIKELKELLPEIQEKIQDMMDYKAETIKRVRESLCPSNGEGSSSGPSSSTAFSSSSSQFSSSKTAASDISHLIKRKRKASDEPDSSAKRPAPATEKTETSDK